MYIKKCFHGFSGSECRRWYVVNIPRIYIPTLKEECLSASILYKVTRMETPSRDLSERLACDAGGRGAVFLTLLIVVVDSHIQRVVLATEETTVTQHVSHRPIKCQSRLWSQRGTKVNGLHRDDNPLLGPTGIQITMKSYATLQAMAPTNIKTVYQTSLLHIESSLDRLELLSPTHDQRSQQQSKQITLRPV